MASTIDGLKRSYNVFYEDPTSNTVYSPIPKKYLQKGPLKTFGMTLRARIPLKQINGPNNFKPMSSQKNKKESTKKSESAPKSGLKRKVKSTVKNVTETISKKAKLDKRFPEKKISTPQRRYRNRLATSPFTPDNPFQLDSPVQRRRSKRLSRCFSQEDFHNHLEHVSSGIKMLQTNSQNLHSAIKKHAIKSPVVEKPQTSDKAHMESHYHELNDNVDVKPLQRSVLRRTMSRVTIKGRILSSKFAKSTSSVQAWKKGYGEMVSSP
uniref:Uncharacterized protein LOC100186715 n=1 Tax=Phallusia mammillata TaxID=59560 RepID=A0A6F9DIJ2_9ASCI|nr:uncharacterized protein LOC100186715 [Phallusia mammillata]